MAHASQNAKRPGLVTLTGFQQLSSFFTELQVCPAMANEIKSFSYADNTASNRAQCNEDITYILQQITQRSRLESFKWIDGYSPSKIEPRPEAFWTALAGAAGTLKHLSFEFATHELHKYRDLTLFPSPFKELLTLQLDLTGGHGNDAFQINKLLSSTHRLTSLSLKLPNCDLKTCRLQGLTYDHHFPNLKAFSLHGFLESDSELANFLLRHPLIRVLHLAVDFAEDDEDDEDDEDEDEELHEDNEDKSKDDKDENDTMIALLPHLSAISIGKFNRWELIPKLLSSSAPRHITHLRLADAGETSVEMIGNAGQSLRCLELSTFCLDEWRKDANNIPMVKLLRDLPELLEVALRLPTAFISMVNDAGDLEHPPPLDVNDLRRLLASLSPTTNIRAVRMSDERGLPLPADFLADLSEVAPPSLEYISWEIGVDEPHLYKLEKTADGRIQAHESKYVRRVPAAWQADDWTNDSILDHVN